MIQHTKNKKVEIRKISKALYFFSVLLQTKQKRNPIRKKQYQYRFAKKGFLFEKDRELYGQIAKYKQPVKNRSQLPFHNS
jgi:uncharacterized protein YaaR (DUF327 family)